MISAAIVGGSGYTGGELLRLLIAHSEINVVQVTSRKYLGQYVYQVHPNLRKQTNLKFSDPDQLEPVEVLFLAMPHGQAQHKIEYYAGIADYLIDLSADFRLRNSQNYEAWYGSPHATPQWLQRFVYGLPELHREELGSANYVSGVGCNATASILCLLPLVESGLLDGEQPVILEIKVGSSESGAEVNPGTHHPERSRVVRTFSPFGHRHTAEVVQELGLHNISLTMTSVDLVRGALHLRELRPNIDQLFFRPGNGLSYQDGRGWRARSTGRCPPGRRPSARTRPRACSSPQRRRCQRCVRWGGRSGAPVRGASRGRSCRRRSGPRRAA